MHSADSGAKVRESFAHTFRPRPRIGAFPFLITSWLSSHSVSPQAWRQERIAHVPVRTGGIAGHTFAHQRERGIGDRLQRNCPFFTLPVSAFTRRVPRFQYPGLTLSIGQSERQNLYFQVSSRVQAIGSLHEILRYGPRLPTHPVH